MLQKLFNNINFCFYKKHKFPSQYTQKYHISINVILYRNLFINIKKEINIIRVYHQILCSINTL